jgi:cbb3-type cytochrome oxidase maturation protein
MDVLILLVFVSIVLVVAALVLFFVALHQRDFEHSERLSLMPLGEPSGGGDHAEDTARAPSPETPTDRTVLERP